MKFQKVPSGLFTVIAYRKLELPFGGSDMAYCGHSLSAKILPQRAGPGRF
jgi:hypothetical protein